MTDKSVRLSRPGFTILPNVVLWDKTLSQGAKLLYAAFRYYAGQAESCWPGQTGLCEGMAISEPTLRKQLRELEERGMVQTHRRGQGQTNVYTVHDHPSADLPRTKESLVLEPKHAAPELDLAEQETAPIGAAARTIAKAPEPTVSESQVLMAYFIDRAEVLAGDRPPGRVVGHTAREIASLLDERFTTVELRAAIDRMLAKGLSPASLPSLAFEVRLAGGGDQGAEVIPLGKERYSATEARRV